MKCVAAVAALVVHAASAAHAGGADVVIPAEIKPLLAAHCVDCHEGARAKGGLDLAAALARGTADEPVLRALRKRLARRDMPPATEDARPTEREYREAVASIDAVVAPAWREVPAVRRLNRAQYAGAVRDVLGLEVDARGTAVRDLLPRDEIGEGFDTTASTLAIPPLLIEKYFDAAERVADACVPPETRVEIQSIPAEKLERRGEGGTHDGVAWLATVGTLSARIEVAYAGRHRITVDACGQFAGEEDPLLQLLCDGTARRTAAITAPAGSSQPVTVEVELSRGRHLIAARFPNDFWAPDFPDPRRRDRNLGVVRITVEGPVDAVPETALAREIRAVGADDAVPVRLARFAARFGEELFRRPISESDCERLARTAIESAGAGAPFDAQMRALLTALLVDPRFLLRAEREPLEPRAPLAAPELASRLAFFLWSSVPDAELRTLGESGALGDVAVLRAQVRRMLADPRASSLAERFATQWLGIDALETRQLDPALFPKVDSALLASMRRETELLFGEVVRGEQPVRALIDARTTRVDARLAAHYGVAPPSGDAWEAREIASDRGSGVLGHASVLVATSNPTRTSPVKRGKWVLQALLDDAPPPPPPGVPQLPERPEEAKGLTMRELMAQHRANPDCAACHVKMDAIGLAFESFAADGRARAEVDDATTLPDGSVLRGVSGVAALLGKDRAFERAFARQLLVYALGRGTADADEPLVDALAAELAAKGEFARLCEEIAVSDAFRTRRTR